MLVTTAPSGIMVSTGISRAIFPPGASGPTNYGPFADSDVVSQPDPEDGGPLSYEVPVAHLQWAVEHRIVVGYEELAYPDVRALDGVEKLAYGAGNRTPESPVAPLDPYGKDYSPRSPV